MFFLTFWNGKYIRRQAIIAFLSNNCIALHLIHLPNKKCKKKVWKSLWLSFVVSVETVHETLLFPVSEDQAPVSLILYHFLLFHVNIGVSDPELLRFFEFFLDSSSSLKGACFCALLSAKLPIAFNFMSSAAFLSSLPF